MRIDIDKPVRLGRAFWCVYVLVLAPSLWFMRPWAWGEPISTEVIASVLFPFLAAVLLYSTSLFLFALATDFPRQHRAFGVCFVGLLGPVTALLVVDNFPGLARGVTGLPGYAAFLMCLLSNTLIFLILSRGKRDAAAAPSSALANPVEGGESDPR